MGRPAIDLTGMEVGRLTVLGRDVSKPSGAGKSVYWLCQCECGNITSVRMDKLRNSYKYVFEKLEQSRLWLSPCFQTRYE